MGEHLVKSIDKIPATFTIRFDSFSQWAAMATASVYNADSYATKTDKEKDADATMTHKEKDAYATMTRKEKISMEEYLPLDQGESRGKAEERGAGSEAGGYLGEDAYIANYQRTVCIHTRARKRCPSVAK